MEYIGYIATFFVLLSFTMKKIEFLRVFNSIGAILFVAYGLLINSNPVIITNTLILLINLTKLLEKEYNEKKTIKTTGKLNERKNKE